MYQGQGYTFAAIMPAVVSSGLFVSLATFSAPDQTQGPTGNPIGTFTPVTGYIDIQCMDAPENTGPTRPAVNENRTEPLIEAERFRHILLDRCYPALRDAAGLGWRVTVDGIIYDLAGAEQDSQATQTRCRLQRVTI